MKYVIGIDPDSKAHGYAVYADSRLITCATATTIDIVTAHIPLLLQTGSVTASIEDVCANTFVYGRNNQKNKQLQARVGMSIGQCQQAQVELMRWLEHIGIEYKLHKPQKGNWSKDSAMFERVTGWAGRSNEDGRSAAFFGWLSL